MQYLSTQHFVGGVRPIVILTGDDAIILECFGRHINAACMGINHRPAAQRHFTPRFDNSFFLRNSSDMLHSDVLAGK